MTLKIEALGRLRNSRLGTVGGRQSTGCTGKIRLPNAPASFYIATMPTKRGRNNSAGKGKTADNSGLCFLSKCAGTESQNGAGFYGDNINSYYDDPHNVTGRFNFVIAKPPFNVNTVDSVGTGLHSETSGLVAARLLACGNRIW